MKNMILILSEARYFFKCFSMTHNFVTSWDMVVEDWSL